MNLFLKIAGIIILIAGVMLTIKPNLISTMSESISPYQMIEKRVMWGILMGLGLFGLVLNHQHDSWKTGIFALLATITSGIIIARIIGLLMDGFFAKQLLWLGIESVFLAIFAILYCRVK